MKHGKRPTAAEKRILTEHGFLCEMWLVVKHTPDCMTIQHRETGKIKHINLREDKQ